MPFIADSEGSVDHWLGPVIHLGGGVGSTPAHRSGVLGSNPGPGEKFSLKLINKTSQTVSLKTKFSTIYFVA